MTACQVHHGNIVYECLAWLLQSPVVAMDNMQPRILPLGLKAIIPTILG